MNYLIRKFNPEKSKQNIIVEVTFLEEGHKCSCVGVLINQNDTEIKIGFNAKDDVVIDSLSIKIKNIIKIREIDQNSIRILQ